jgi:hypothetical protein
LYVSNTKRPTAMAVAANGTFCSTAPTAASTARPHTSRNAAFAICTESDCVGSAPARLKESLIFDATALAEAENADIRDAKNDGADGGDVPLAEGLGEEEEEEGAGRGGGGASVAEEGCDERSTARLEVSTSSDESWD